MNTLEIIDLSVEIEGKEIIRNVNLTIKEGEIHALMGPNGSGKTTLAHTIMGNRNYRVKSGKILLNGEDITNLPPDERAKRGLFLTFQNPVELSGVKLFSFLRTAHNVHYPDDKRTFQEFISYIQSRARMLNMDTSLLSRNVNEGFSGGERKKSEILQLAVLKPKFAIVDEIDSGLDVDALEAVAKTIEEIIEKEYKIGILLITHYQRILKYLKPHYVHVMMDGTIVMSDNYDLALKIEESGYEWIKNRS